jgi:hypothetical protein
MKRNKTTKAVPKSGTPPYTRYKKRPHTYSAAYHDWRRGAMAGQVREIA